MKRLLVLLFAVCIGCSSGTRVSTPHEADIPVFSLAVSEYPAWATFLVAQEKGLIGKGDELGTLEKKWNVKIKLKLADYDNCMVLFGAGQKGADAACLTNTDCPKPSLGRPMTAIIPTSTSIGADALIAVGYKDINALKGQKIYGLEKSVSEYFFYRMLEDSGYNTDEFQYVNMDPGAAAQAMQTNSPNIKAIVVWNPFKMQTLETCKKSKVLATSEKIPGEIIDMVVVGNDSLARPGGDRFACCVCDVYYEVCKMMADRTTRNDTLVALGAKFSNLSAEKMALCCEETHFYSTPSAGLDVFTGESLPQIMKKVVTFNSKRRYIERKPTIDYSSNKPATAVNITFDPQYMRKVRK